MLNRSDDTATIVQPPELISTGCLWRNMLLPVDVDGLILGAQGRLLWSPAWIRCPGFNIDAWPTTNQNLDFSTPSNLTPNPLLLHTFEILFSFASTCIYSSCFLGTVSMASLSPGFLVLGIAAMDVDYVSMSPIQLYSSPRACAAKCLFSYAKSGKFYSYSFDLLVSSRLLLLLNCKRTIVRVNNRYCKVSLFETSKTTPCFLLSNSTYS